MRFLLLALGVILVAAPPAKSETADTIFLNGNVYTVNEAAPIAQAIAIKGERILFVGANEGAKKFSGAASRTVDLKGKTVLPGLTDSHCHILGVGERLTHLNLDDATTKQAFLARIKKQAGEVGAGRWVTGRGWIETLWKPPVFPTRQDLDEVAPNNPVFLTRADGHGAVANSKAFAIAGIDSKTPDPFGGQILRDKKTGEPLGMLLDNAIELVEKQVPPPSADETARAVVLGAERSVKLGWCEIQNAGSQIPEFELLQKLDRDGKLKIRIYNAVYGPGPAADRLLKNGPIVDSDTHRFTTRTIKVVFDGSLGSRSAALLSPTPTLTPRDS